MMQKVSALVINLVDIGTSIEKLLNGRILSADQGILKSKETRVIHLVDICTKVQHLVCQLEILLLVEVEEGSAALAVGEINSYIKTQKVLEHMLMVDVKRIEMINTHQIERSHLIIIW